MKARWRVGDRVGLFVLVECLSRYWRARCDCGVEVVGPACQFARRAHGCRRCHAAARVRILRCRDCGVEDPARFKTRPSGQKVKGRCMSCQKRAERARVRSMA